MKVDFKNYTFRASQVSKLTGRIGLTKTMELRLKEILSRKSKALMGELDDKGKKVAPIPPTWVTELEKLKKIKADDSFPLTMQTELRKIHRAERHNRNFQFTNKYVQKGIGEEDEAITVLQTYLKEVMKVRVLLKKNEERKRNDHFDGECDIAPFLFLGQDTGFDTKCAWELDTFPYKDDPLNPAYFGQNNVYMDLWEVKQWVTATVLVNASEHAVMNEKNKWLHASRDENGLPDDEEHPKHKLWIKKLKEIERKMIFDYDRFMFKNPHAQLEYSATEWKHLQLDIPLVNRVVMKYSLLDEKYIEGLKERIVLCRKELCRLDENY